jgi:NitT/TauT family transport system ATP-binding protein
MTTKLEAQNITMEFYQPRTGRRLTALKDVNLKLEEGEFLSIVGPSGCGKTTFLNIVDGLLQPTSGRILLDGKPVNKPGNDRGMVFQSGALMPWRTVEKNIIYGLECRKWDRRKALEVAKRIIEMVGLVGFEHHYPHELSGGMRQRVNLGRALAIDPEILLMDEPFAALDAQTREIMQAELLAIRAKAKKTMLFITHQINEAIFLSDRIAVFSARPGCVKEILDINLPRPRHLNIKTETQFLDYERRIWNIIESEVKKTMAADRSTRDAEARVPLNPDAGT